MIDPQEPIPQSETDFLNALLRCPKCSTPMDLDTHCMGSCPKCGYKEVDDL